MIYAIISDIHANENALRRVLRDAKSQGAERIICLGDVVGYGPAPAETVSIVRKANMLVLTGNHDAAVAGHMDVSGFNEIAADAIARHREVLSSEDMEWLGSLGHVYEGEGFIAAHGDFTSPESFCYISNDEDAAANFAATSSQLMFVGHTHVPQISLTGNSGKVYTLEPQDFTLEDGKRYIVNPGSVGYPRENDGKCLSSYVIYDSTNRSVFFRFLPFSVSSVLQRGRTVKPTLKKFVAVCLMMALLGAAVAVMVMAGRNDSPQQGVEVAPQDSSLRVAAKEVPLDGTAVKVTPDLKLRKGSDSVLLVAEFKDGKGKVLSTQQKTVKVTCEQKFVAPEGSAKAVFTLLKTKPTDQVDLIRFKPRTVEERCK